MKAADAVYYYASQRTVVSPARVGEIVLVRKLGYFLDCMKSRRKPLSALRGNPDQKH